MRPDAIVVGFGWAGSLIAHQLSQAGLRVMAFERGPWRDTSTEIATTYAADELRYAIRQELFLPPSVETVTFRNNKAQQALPMRRSGAFILGAGVGGSGLHWNGQTWRFLPSDFRLRSHVTSRYGTDFIDPELTLTDWPLTYDDLEPHYDRFERLAGVSGQAGNIGGRIIQGGNPFEGPRRAEYPLPPLKTPYASAIFRAAAIDLGLHPFPGPAANASTDYTNPLGLRMGPCTYCGFCERFGCANYAKGSPQTAILPALLLSEDFVLRTGCEVTRIDLRADGQHARGVTYRDEAGQEQSLEADLVILSAYTLHNVRLMLLSGIGTPYDPLRRVGTIGRAYSYQSFATARLFFDNKILNPFMGAGGTGQTVDDANGDNFDHGRLGFIGGASITSNVTNGRPILARPVRPGTPRWGQQWKEETRWAYLRNHTLVAQGSSLTTPTNWLDLDPTYTDRYGRPLLRMTFNYPQNDLRMLEHMRGQLETIGRAMGANLVHSESFGPNFSIVPYQATHNCGGAVMGSDPTASAVNRYLQSWDVPNVFVVGASAFVQNAGYNPTGTVGALALWAADAIIRRYLLNPGRQIE